MKTVTPPKMRLDLGPTVLTCMHVREDSCDDGYIALPFDDALGSPLSTFCSKREAERERSLHRSAPQTTMDGNPRHPDLLWGAVLQKPACRLMSNWVCAGSMMPISPAKRNRPRRTHRGHGVGAPASLSRLRWYRHRYACTPHSFGTPSHTFFIATVTFPGKTLSLGESP